MIVREIPKYDSPGELDVAEEDVVKGLLTDVNGEFLNQEITPGEKIVLLVNDRI